MPNYFIACPLESIMAKKQDTETNLSGILQIMFCPLKNVSRFLSWLEFNGPLLLNRISSLKECLILYNNSIQSNPRGFLMGQDWRVKWRCLRGCSAPFWITVLGETWLKWLIQHCKFLKSHNIKKQEILYSRMSVFTRINADFTTQGLHRWFIALFEKQGHQYLF